MRIMTLSNALIAVMVGISAASGGQDQGSKAAIQRKLESQYLLTKTTDDKTDIVTAGSVLVLQKDKLEMVAVATTGNPCPNTYRDGKITQSGACRTGEKIKKIPLFGHAIPGADKAPTTRNFVTGEKFWVTKIDVKDGGKDSGVVLELFTDAISDIRYKASLTIPLKAGMQSPDEILKLVADVVTVAPSDDAKGNEAKGNAQQPAPQAGQQSAAAGAAQPAAAASATVAAAEAPPATDRTSASSTRRRTGGIAGDRFGWPNTGSSRGCIGPAAQEGQGRHQRDLLLQGFKSDVRQYQSQGRSVGWCAVCTTR